MIYYGSDHDNEEDVKHLWHRQAQELCAGREYEVIGGQSGDWKSNGFVLLPPVVVAAESANTTYSGEVFCSDK